MISFVQGSKQGSVFPSLCLERLTIGRSEVTKKEWIEAVNLLPWELAAML